MTVARESLTLTLSLKKGEGTADKTGTVIVADRGREINGPKIVGFIASRDD